MRRCANAAMRRSTVESVVFACESRRSHCSKRRLGTYARVATKIIDIAPRVLVHDSMRCSTSKAFDRVHGVHRLSTAHRGPE